MGFALSGSLLSVPIHFSTHFSGIGCAEQAVSLVAEAYRSCAFAEKSETALSRSSPSLKCVSCCEINVACQKVLAGQAEHVFMDIEAAFPTIQVQATDSLEKKWKAVRAALAPQSLRRCATHFLCRQPLISLDVSGSPCQPWSRAGRGKGMADSRSLLLLMWAALMLQLKPAIAVHENVVGFDTSVLQDWDVRE